MPPTHPGTEEPGAGEDERHVLDTDACGRGALGLVSGEGR